MAITFEQRRSGSGLFWVMVFFTVILGSFWLGYELFLGPIEEKYTQVLSQDQQIVLELSKLDIDPASVVNSPKYKVLRKHIPDVVAGQTGRQNPFLPF